ncbi:MAG: type II toxin-antitoxin system HicA family toxin [Candidatus Margulisbacteria bacterium]|nr:type II toxin-antitoxin system HicA family toxin [Candidatus Margulisiibacteriota bacterium]
MRFPSLKPKEVIKALKRANYYVDHQTGSHITLLKDLAKSRVVVPFHSKDLKKGTLHGIIKQSGLTEEEFINLL